MTEPDLTRAGSAEFYDLGGPDYDDLPFYRDRAAVLGATSLLELGCGTGRVLVPLARELPRVAGVDVSAEYVAAARAKLAAAGSGSVRLETARVEGLDLGERFDLVIAAYHVIQAFPAPPQLAAFFETVGRHLAPGGRCVLSAFRPAAPPEVFAERWARPGEQSVWSRRLPDGTVVEHLDRRLRVDLDPLVLHLELIWRRSTSGVPLDEARVPISMRVHYPEPFRRLAEEHGFTVTGAYGGYSGEPYGEGPELVLELAR